MAGRRTIELVLAGAVLLGVAVFFLGAGPAPPPGFIRDEASISYNAYTLSQNLHDQNGGAAPLYIKSFGDYKSPLFVYVLAGVLRVTGPSKHVALATGAFVVLLAILLLGYLAWRLSRSLLVAVFSVVLASFTPWLYELGRTAYETTIEPLTIMLVVLAVFWASRSDRAAVVRAVPVGLSLALLSYSYAAGRLLSPLWALALLVFAGRRRRRFVLASWAVYVIGMMPLIAFSLIHTGALSARYQSTTFIQSGMSKATIVGDFLSHYVHDSNLWHWTMSGDPKPYIRTAGEPQLFAATVVLAIIGVVVIARRRRGDLFWRYVIAALVLSPAPAALTADRYYSLRLLPIPVLLAVLAIPGIDALRRAALVDWPARFAAAALGLLLALQVTQFISNHNENNGGRSLAFEAGVPSLLARGFDTDRTIYIDHDDVYAQTHALWYAVTHEIPRARVVILSDGGAPPTTGSIAFGRLQTCDYTCLHIADYGTYWIARAQLSG